MGLEPSVYEINGVYSLNLIADPDAFAAENALTRIAFD